MLFVNSLDTTKEFLLPLNTAFHIMGCERSSLSTTEREVYDLLNRTRNSLEEYWKKKGSDSWSVSLMKTCWTFLDTLKTRFKVAFWRMDYSEDVKIIITFHKEDDFDNILRNPGQDMLIREVKATIDRIFQVDATVTIKKNGMLQFHVNLLISIVLSFN